MISSSTALNAGAGLAIVSRPTTGDGAGGRRCSSSTIRSRRSKTWDARRGRARWRRSSPSPAASARPAPRRCCSSRLSQSGQTHASAASFNNHWGVPLTLARMQRECAFGVFEIGMNHAGEITPLDAHGAAACRHHHDRWRRAISDISLRSPTIADAKAEIFLGRRAGRRGAHQSRYPNSSTDWPTAARDGRLQQDCRLRPARGGRRQARTRGTAQRLLLRHGHHPRRDGRSTSSGVPGEHHAYEQPCRSRRRQACRRRSGARRARRLPTRGAGQGPRRALSGSSRRAATSC